MTDRTALRALKEKELFVFDMDGTIYLGENVFPEARDFILRLRREGKRVLFFTNNASHTPDFYISRLTRMGFEPRRDEIMTSGDVTVAYLRRERPGKTVYLVGTPDLVRSFRESGIILTCDDNGVPDGRIPDIVITSFDTTVTYDKLRHACDYIRGGAEYLSTHPDFNCPCETGFIPDSGAIAALVTASTGVSPTYFGKPEKTCADMIAASCGTAKEKTVMFGDRLYTDIATGRRAGITAVLVLTGETTPEMLAKAEGDNVPDIVAESLGEVAAAMFGGEI